MKKLIIIGVVALITTNSVMAEMTCGQLLDEYSEIEVNGTGEEMNAICKKIRKNIKEDKKCLKLAKKAFYGKIDRSRIHTSTE